MHLIQLIERKSTGKDGKDSAVLTLKMSNHDLHFKKKRKRPMRKDIKSNILTKRNKIKMLCGKKDDIKHCFVS